MIKGTDHVIRGTDHVPELQVNVASSLSAAGRAGEGELDLPAALQGGPHLQLAVPPSGPQRGRRGPPHPPGAAEGTAGRPRRLSSQSRVPFPPPPADSLCVCASCVPELVVLGAVQHGVVLLAHEERASEGRRLRGARAALLPEVRAGASGKDAAAVCLVVSVA